IGQLWRKREISEENRTFNAKWADSFAFPADENGSNVSRHFLHKHAVFAQNYPDGDERKKLFQKWMKSGKPFTDGEYLRPGHAPLCKSVTDRTIKMVEDISSAVASLFCRYVNSAGPQEDVVEPSEEVSVCLRAKGINPPVAADGAPSDRRNRGLVALLQKSLGRKLLTSHCILHQQALCAPAFPLDVMNVVIQIVDKIMAKGLNPRRFSSLLDELESTYSDLLLNNQVRWLCRGEELKRFAESLEEVETFWAAKFPELEQPEWLEKLHVLYEPPEHLNTLQGEGHSACMSEEVWAFERRLTRIYRKFKEAHMMNLEYLHSAVIAKQTSFGKRFSSERKIHIILLPSVPEPRSIPVQYDGISRCDPPDLRWNRLTNTCGVQVQRLTANLEDVSRQEAVLTQDHRWCDVENLLKPDKPVCTWSPVDLWVHMCEQLFSTMNFIKSNTPHRRQVTILCEDEGDKHPQRADAALRTRITSTKYDKCFNCLLFGIY
uniref:SCAN box domain-containing protein n=1 Tax=Poecilia latipinna TaxID=48699 RepID=A0A3B3UWQ1_9TELE